MWNLLASQDVVEAEYQNRSEVTYWLNTLRMAPQLSSLNCVTDRDGHRLDKSCMDAQEHIEVLLLCGVGVWSAQTYR